MEVQRWRCRDAEVQNCRGAEVQRCGGAEVQRCLDADDKVEDPSERSREEEAGEDGGPDEAVRIEAATRQVELLHVHGGHARGGSGAAQMACRVRQRSGGAASMTWAEGYGRLARQLERRRARAEARNERSLDEHSVCSSSDEARAARPGDEGAICADPPQRWRVRPPPRVAYTTGATVSKSLLFTHDNYRRNRRDIIPAAP